MEDFLAKQRRGEKAQMPEAFAFKPKDNKPKPFPMSVLSGNTDLTDFISMEKLKKQPFSKTPGKNSKMLSPKKD